MKVFVLALLIVAVSAAPAGKTGKASPPQKGKADGAQPRDAKPRIPDALLNTLTIITSIPGSHKPLDPSDFPGLENIQTLGGKIVPIEVVPANKAPDGSRLLDPILGKVNKLPAVGGVVSKLIGGGDGGQGQGLGGLVSAGGANPVQNVLINIIKAILGLLSLPGHDA